MSKHGITTIRNLGTGGKSGTVEFKSNKPHSVAPKFVDQVLGDDGEIYLVLVNGNLILKTRYDAMWSVPKTAILPQNTKGENPDKTKVV